MNQASDSLASGQHKLAGDPPPSRQVRTPSARTFFSTHSQLSVNCQRPTGFPPARICHNCTQQVGTNKGVPTRICQIFFRPLRFARGKTNPGRARWTRKTSGARSFSARPIFAPKGQAMSAQGVGGAAAEALGNGLHQFPKKAPTGRANRARSARRSICRVSHTTP